MHRRLYLQIAGIFVIAAVGAFAIHMRISRSGVEIGKPPLEELSIEDLKVQKDKAARGNLEASEGLRAYYCMYKSDAQECDEWIIRSATLGDESLRCMVITDHQRYGRFSQYTEQVKKLEEKGECK